MRLVNLLKSCNGQYLFSVWEEASWMFSFGVLARLQDAIKRPVSQELTTKDSRALIALVNIVSLLAENCNFDTLRKEHSSAHPD